MPMTDAERIAALETDNNRLRAALDDATKAQVSREDLKKMSPAERVKAVRDGRAKDLLSGK